MYDHSIISAFIIMLKLTAEKGGTTKRWRRRPVPKRIRRSSVDEVNWEEKLEIRAGGSEEEEVETSDR